MNTLRKFKCHSGQVHLIHGPVPFEFPHKKPTHRRAAGESLHRLLWVFESILGLSLFFGLATWSHGSEPEVLPKLAFPMLDDDYRRVTDKVPKWIMDLESADPLEQTVAVHELFRFAIDFNLGDDASVRSARQVADYLKLRGLRYSAASARHEAIVQLSLMLLRRAPDELLPFARDATNDSNPKTRAVGYIVCGGYLKQKAAKSEVIDAIVDLAVNKGLRDENQDVATEALIVTSTEKLLPNEARFRALNHALRTGGMHEAVRDTVEDIHAKWKKMLFESPPEKK